jgi:hypothetical protein
MTMPQRAIMERLFQEARELEAREHTPEEEIELRSRAPTIIEAACKEQHNYNDSVLSPSCCLICNACPIATIVKGVAGLS